MSVRVELPLHLARLAGCRQEVMLTVPDPVTLGAVLDALEACYPMLAGTIREHGTGRRRAFLRFFVEEADWSHIGMEVELPRALTEGRVALLVVGAIAGG